ncbi:MAG: hypothetical protein IME93_05595 [Proteobacteria bacterium]|nr:hypothetical protein [Pseudomonadota bacterium]
MACIEKAQALGIHVETRTNIIPGYNDEPDMIAEIARWVHDHLGADSPWHVTRFFPAFKMSHVAATPVEMLERAGELGKAQGLKNVYVYADQGCDCAKENLPPEVYLGREAAELYETKKCSASCCGDEGVLLKKFEEGL